MAASVLVGPVTTIAAEPAVAASQEEAGKLLEHLAGIDRSLQEISVLLTSILDHQQLDVLLSRMQLKERSQVPLQDELNRARADRDGLSAEINRLQAIRQEWERARNAATPGDPVNESEAREMRRLFSELERLEEREAVLIQRVIELEDDLARRRDDIRTLEEMVDARLGLR
jgi:chromosome segregation ATPase